MSSAKLKSNRPFQVRYPTFYRAIYKAYNIIRKDLLGTGSAMQIFSAIITIILTHHATRSILWTSVSPVIIYGGLFILRELLGLFIDHVLKHTGSDVRFWFPGKYVIKSAGNPFWIETGSIDKRMLEFATPDTAIISAQLNMKGYSRTAWHTSLEDKLKRNASHIAKNKKCILLIKSADGRYIGYTHILPVSETIWKRYKAGKIGDNVFSAQNICPTHQTSKSQKPFGLILFSVVAAERVIEFKDPKTYALEVGSILEQAIAYHLATFIELYFEEEEEIPVLFQNEGRNFLKFFEPQLDPIEISYDGAKIITFDVSNPYARHSWKTA